ncbi:MAG TPA: protein kinase [Steroidobacteraceae bacterium]|nr:protein kinase [Steroidobacteraceae bacterium]
MADETGPVLVVVGDDLKRLQWLNHHVTSHWPNSRVTTFSPKQSATLARALQDAEPDAVLLQIDFTSEDSASLGISQMLHLIKLRPGLHCIVLADHGTELTAVRALKSGAADYVPVANLTRESLLAAVSDAAAKRREAAQAARSFDPADADSAAIEVPGYAIIKEIATSNFSSVFLARSERLRRNVVLKIMKRGSSTREMEDAERFQREYEIISSVTHRSIAEIYDFGTLPQHLYLAMEYFPCGDLRERLCNPVSVEEAIYYLRTIAEALRVIHVFGILHRDLKPANVMLREDNSPVLIDFGLARRAIGDIAVTGVGQVLGSPYYISPEQAQGQAVDARTDLYSLGVIFYEMLTGQKPYAGRSAVAIMAQHTSSPIPVLPPDVAQQQPLLDRLMAKDAHSRYTSADELLADLSAEAEAPA